MRHTCLYAREFTVRDDAGSRGQGCGERGDGSASAGELSVDKITSEERRVENILVRSKAATSNQTSVSVQALILALVSPLHVSVGLARYAVEAAALPLLVPSCPMSHVPCPMDS